MSLPKTKKFYVILAITLVIMFGFGYLPTFGQVTPTGMKVLGVFIGMIFAWTMGEIVWPSIIGLVISAAFSLGTFNENYDAAFGNSTTAVIVMGMVFCYAISACGLLGELARWLLGLKIVQRSKYTLILGFYITGVILGALATQAPAVIILLWALFYEIAKELHLKPYSSYVSIVMCGIAVCSYAGVVLMPYGSMAVIVAGVAKSFDENYVFDTVLYMGANFINVILFVPLLMFVIKFIIRPKFDFEFSARDRYTMQLTKEMKITLVVFALMFVALIVPNFLPQDSFGYNLFINQIGTAGILAVAAILLAVIHVDGKPIFDLEKGISDGVSWGLIVLMSAAIAVSNFITADGMGIVPTIVSWFEPLVAGRSAIAVTVIFVVVGLIMTNFINDMVTAIVLYPIAASFIIQAGGSVELFGALFTAAVIQGCFMPSGSVVGALMHGNAEWLRSKDVFKYVGIMEATLCITLALVTFLGSALGF